LLDSKGHRNPKIDFRHNHPRDPRRVSRTFIATPLKFQSGMNSKLIHLVAIARFETWHFLTRYLVGAILNRITLPRWLKSVWDNSQIRRLGHLIGMNDTSRLGLPPGDDAFQQSYVAAELSGSFSKLSLSNTPTSSLSPNQLFRLSHAHFSSGNYSAGNRCTDLATSQLRQLFNDKPETSVALLGQAWTAALGHSLLINSLLQGSELSLLPFERYIVIAPLFAQPNRVYLRRLEAEWDRLTVIESVCSEALNSHFEGFGVPLARIPNCGGTTYDAPAMCDAVAWERSRQAISTRQLVSSRMQEAAHRCLERWGIRNSDLVVTIHVRTGSAPAGRGLENADIRTYIPALRYLASRGYRVVRLGDPSMPKLPPIPGVTDCAHLPERSPWLDMYLWQRSHFAIGTCSGGSEGFRMFDRPTIYTNTTAIARWPFGSRSFFVPKLFRRPGASKPICIEEMVKSPWGLSDALCHEGWSDTTIVDNSPDDIFEAVLEMESLLASGSAGVPPSDVQESLMDYRQSIGRTERSVLSSSFARNHPYLY